MASPACPYSPDPLWQEQEGAMGKGPAERQVNALGNGVGAAGVAAAVRGCNSELVGAGPLGLFVSERTGV